MKSTLTLTILFLIALKSSLFAQRQFQFQKDAIKISYTAQTLNVTTFSFSIIDTSIGVSFSVQNFAFSISDSTSKINIGSNIANLVNAVSQNYSSAIIDSFSSKIDINLKSLMFRVYSFAGQWSKLLKEGFREAI